MATRRRRTTQPATPEPTHEEMLEVAAEREAEQVVEEDEEKAIEVFMAMAAADTFEAMYKAEEEKGVADFFDPSFYAVRSPAEVVAIAPAPAPPKPQHNIPRVTRGVRGSDRRG